MDRRLFLSLAGSAAIIPAAATGLSPMSVPSAPAAAAGRIATAIQGAFGAGFRVRSADVIPGGTRCVIEHNGNVLRVSSADLRNWRIEAATPM